MSLTLTVLVLGVSRPPTSGIHERPSRVRGYKHVHKQWITTKCSVYGFLDKYIYFFELYINLIPHNIYNKEVNIYKRQVSFIHSFRTRQMLLGQLATEVVM